VGNLRGQLGAGAADDVVQFDFIRHRSIHRRSFAISGLDMIAKVGEFCWEMTIIERASGITTGSVIDGGCGRGKVDGRVPVRGRTSTRPRGRAATSSCSQQGCQADAAGLHLVC